MSISDIMSCPTARKHDSWREGVRLGLIVATTTWLWIALVDALAGRPFHTFNGLGGVGPFTVVHYLLCVAYGVVILSVIHAAERAPSVIFGLMFGIILFECAFAMVTNLIAVATLGNIAWVSIFGANVLAAALAFALLARTHPLATYLRRGEEER
ncbi:MAG: hypothetical protein ABI442_03075 [Gemmatimonadaceae bacterium]